MHASLVLKRENDDYRKAQKNFCAFSIDKITKNW
jgi:hypothetical protein